MKDHSCSWMIWSIALIVALGLGLWGGLAIARGYDKPEITRLQNELDNAKNESDFWKVTLHGLAEGKQFEGVELNGRPSVGD